MSQESRDYRVGLFTFVGIVVLGVLILLYGEEPTWILTTRYDLEIRVDHPTGIGEGTPAFMQGVQVGRVSEIKFQDPGLPSSGAAVIVGIDDEYDIPKGSTATIHPSFGFDKGAINIHPPEDPSEPLPHKDSYIEGEMKGALESIVPEDYITNLGAVVDQMRNTADQFGQMATKIGVVSDDLHELLQLRTVETVDDATQDVPANLYTAVQRADELIRLINEMLREGGDLHAAAANLREWTAKLDARTEELVTQADDTMKSIQQRTAELSSKLIDTLGTMSRVLDEVHSVTVAVNEGDGVLGNMLHDPKLYEELIDSLALLQVLIQDLRELKVWIEHKSVLKGL